MEVHRKIWFFRGRREKESGKKRGGVISFIFGRQGACHDITKSADSQTNINFSKNDRIIAEILQKRLSNKWLQTADLMKQESIWKNSNWVETDASGQSTF